MKLAEALMIRSDYQVRIEKLKNRILNNVKIQEGEEVSENPNDLLKELDELLVKLEDIVGAINKTNSHVMLKEGLTISSALTKRDSIFSNRSILEQVVYEASIKQSRISRSEIKFTTTVDVQKLQKKIDNLSKEYRLLDTKIQEKNWLVEFIRLI